MDGPDGRRDDLEELVGAGDGLAERPFGATRQRGSGEAAPGDAVAVGGLQQAALLPVGVVAPFSVKGRYGKSSAQTKAMTCLAFCRA